MHCLSSKYFTRILSKLLFSLKLISGDLRFEMQYEIEYENGISILVFKLRVISTHVPISSYELPSA